jgi:hypothetical protein
MRTRSDGWSPGSTITSVRLPERSDPSASAQRGGASTPNVQRIWFFRDDAR